MLKSVVQLPLMKTIFFKVTCDMVASVAVMFLASKVWPLPSIVIVLLIMIGLSSSLEIA